MKILIVSYSDISGGAAKAAHRLHSALLKKKINSKMLVLKKKSKDAEIYGPETRIEKIIFPFLPLVERIKAKILYASKKGMFSPGSTSFPNIINKINLIKPDIVHLHWINGGMLRIEDLVKINAPIIWSLQDMWPLTGGCHFCNYNIHDKVCDKCNKIVYLRKSKIYKKIDKLIINGPSRWITNLAKKSSLFKGRRIINLPNIIDTNLFKPCNKKISRKLFDIPFNKKVILFGATDINDPRKGLKELLLALSKLIYPNLIVVIAGQNKPKFKINLKYPVYYIPPVNDDLSLSALYNLANVVVLPSIQDNLSNIVIESMSCGVPVVAFNIGGNSDMIDHKVNGYLAEPKNIFDLAIGIEWSLKNEDLHLSKNARKKILKKFSYFNITKKYINLYKAIL